MIGIILGSILYAVITVVCISEAWKTLDEAEEFIFLLAALGNFTVLLFLLGKVSD